MKIEALLACVHATINKEMEKNERKCVGSTTMICLSRPELIEGKWHYVFYGANVGDSEGYLYKMRAADAKLDRVPLFTMHNHSNKDEVERVAKTGGKFSGGAIWNRGSYITMSRALGDFDMAPMLIGEPSLHVHAIPMDELQNVHVVLGSDGFWERLPAGTVEGNLESAEGLEKQVDAMMRAAKKVSSDNISVLVARFTV